MKKKRFSEEQIVGMLGEAETPPIEATVRQGKFNSPGKKGARFGVNSNIPTFPAISNHEAGGRGLEIIQN